MPLQPVILESQNAMSAVDGAQSSGEFASADPTKGEEDARVQERGIPRKDFSQCMQQHKIFSTSSAISPQQERIEPSGHGPCRRGVKSSLQREPDAPRDLLRAIFGNVTEPLRRIVDDGPSAPCAARPKNAGGARS